MNKEQWENLKVGDKVRVKPFGEISKGLSGSILVQSSEITSHRDSFEEQMKDFCGKTYIIHDFYEGDKAACLIDGEYEYNFLPEWLEVKEEPSEIEKLEEIKKHLDKAHSLCYELALPTFHALMTEGGIESIRQAKEELEVFIINSN